MSLDATDAYTLHRRLQNWDATASMSFGTLRYQMGGRPGVDPYGWREDRINRAIETGKRIGILKIEETFFGAAVVAIELLGVPA